MTENGARSRQWLRKATAEMLSVDGIHATGDGCDKIATGVIALLEARGLRR